MMAAAVQKEEKRKNGVFHMPNNIYILHTSLIKIHKPCTWTSKTLDFYLRVSKASHKSVVLNPDKKIV